MKAHIILARTTGGCTALFVNQTFVTEANSTLDRDCQVVVAAAKNLAEVFKVPLVEVTIEAPGGGNWTWPDLVPLVLDAVAETTPEWSPMDGPMSDARYLAAAGTVCPACGSNEISADRCSAEGPEATQEVKCITCGANWADSFVLTGYHGLEDGVDADTIRTVVDDVRTRAKEYGFSIDSEAQARECISESAELRGLDGLTTAEIDIAVEELTS